MKKKIITLLATIKKTKVNWYWIFGNELLCRTSRNCFKNVSAVWN